MTQTAPVTDWATDFDVMDPAVPGRSLQHLGPVARDLSDSPHRAAQEQLDAARATTTSPPSPTTSSTSARVKVAVIPGDEDADPEEFDGPEPRVRAAPDLGGPAAAHVDPPSPLAVVLAHSASTATCRSPATCAAACSTGSPARATPTRPPTMPSRSPCGSSRRSSGVSPDLSDTFTGWVRDVLEFADDPERRQHGAEGLLNYFFEQLELRRKDPGDDLLSELLHDRGGRQAGRRRHRARHGRAGAHRRRRHDLECHRVVAVAPGLAPRGPGAPRRRARAHADCGRGAAAGLRARDHGARGRPRTWCTPAAR